MDEPARARAASTDPQQRPRRAGDRPHHHAVVALIDDERPPAADLQVHRVVELGEGLDLPPGAGIEAVGAEGAQEAARGREDLNPVVRRVRGVEEAALVDGDGGRVVVLPVAPEPLPAAAELPWLVGVPALAGIADHRHELGHARKRGRRRDAGRPRSVRLPHRRERRGGIAGLATARRRGDRDPAGRARHDALEVVADHLDRDRQRSARGPGPRPEPAGERNLDRRSVVVGDGERRAPDAPAAMAERHGPGAEPARLAVDRPRTVDPNEDRARMAVLVGLAGRVELDARVGDAGGGGGRASERGGGGHGGRGGPRHPGPRRTMRAGLRGGWRQ